MLGINSGSWGHHQRLEPVYAGVSPGSWGHHQRKVNLKKTLEDLGSRLSREVLATQVKT